MTKSNFAPTLWYNPQTDGQPIKIGGIDKPENNHSIFFSECKLHIDEKNVIIYGYGIVDGLVKHNDNGTYKAIEFKEPELLQIRLPISEEEKGSTLFTQTVGRWLKFHYGEIKENSLTFTLALNSCDRLNLEEVKKHPEWTFTQEKCPLIYIFRSVFPDQVIEIESDKLKDFTYQLTESTGNKKKPFGGSYSQKESEKLADRLSFLKSLLYPDMKVEETKDLGVKEMSKAFNSLSESEQSIVNLLMK
jgi:hypothetical protein